MRTDVGMVEEEGGSKKRGGNGDGKSGEMEQEAKSHLRLMSD